MTTRLPVVGSTAASTAFCMAQVDGPGNTHLFIDGNGKITSSNGTLAAPSPNAFSLPAAAVSGIEHCPGSTESCRKACLASHHKILTADLRYISLADVQVGDKIVAFDESLNTKVGPRRSRRRFRTGTITALHHRMADVLAVKLTSGKTFFATKDHQWLTCEPQSRSQRWKYTDELQSGTCVPRLMDEWSPDGSYEAGWLSGMYDGEGCYTVRKSESKSASRLVLSQKSGPVLERARAAITSVLGKDTTTSRAQARSVFQLEVKGGYRAVSKALGVLRPTRLLPKFRPEHLGEIRGSDEDTVVSVTACDVQAQITEIQVDHGTMIVEGYGHHNCYVGPLSKAQQAVYECYDHNAWEIRRILADQVGAGMWASLMARWISQNARGGFRWHVSGDVFSPTYARWIAAVCEESPSVNHWIYTRSFEEDYLRPLVEVSTLRGGNLAVNLSADADNYDAALEASVKVYDWGADDFLRICYLTLDGVVPNGLRGSDVIFPDYQLRPRQYATLAESPWWQGLVPRLRGLVCPVDAHGKSEKSRCGPCDRCLT